MDRRLTVSVLVSALCSVAFGALLSGCSSDHPEKLPPTSDPVVWVGRVCSSLGPLGALRNQRPNFDPNDPAASRDSLSRYFDDTERRISDSLNGLEQVGPSPIPGGDDATAKMRAALERLRGAFNTARQQVDGVDPQDPVELGSKLPEILSGLAQASTDKDLTNLGGNAALADAVRQSPSCGMLTGAATTPNPDPGLTTGTN